MKTTPPAPCCSDCANGRPCGSSREAQLPPELGAARSEHVAELRPAAEYARFRSGPFGGDTGIRAVFGIRHACPVEVQALMFSSDLWTPSKARAWLKANGYKAELQPAGGRRPSGKKARASVPEQAAPKASKTRKKGGTHEKGGGPQTLHGTGALARVPESQRAWIGKQYGFGQKGLAPVTNSKAGQIYLLTADPAEGMQAVLVVGQQAGGTLVHWLTGSRTGTQTVIFRPTFWKPIEKATQTPLTFAPKGQVSMFGTGRGRSVTGDPITAWRKALTSYLGLKRKDRSSGTALEAFWLATLTFLDSFGWTFRQDPRFASPVSADLIQASMDWWAGQVGGLAPDAEELAAMARAGATKLRSAGRAGQVEWEHVAPFLAVLIRLVVATEQIPAVYYARQAPAPKAARGQKAGKRAKAGNPCTPPKRRQGAAAQCRGDWDSIQACIIRSGGLRADTPEAGELIYAAGDRRHVPPRMLTKNGQTWSRLAQVLTDQGFVLADEHGRADEAAALQVATNALRGGRRGALPQANACAARRLEQGADESYAAQGVKRARRPKRPARARSAGSRGLTASERRALERAMKDLPPGEYEVNIH